MTKKRTALSSSRKTKTSNETMSYRDRVLQYVRKAKSIPIKTALLIAGTTAAILIDFLYGTASAVLALPLYQFALGGKFSGRMDSTVLNRNGTTRGMTVPALVQNEATSTQRNNFAGLSSDWNSLTQVQMQGWNEAVGFTRSNRFGVSVPLKGKELFIALNRSLFNIGETVLNDVPLPVGIANVETATLICDVSDTRVRLTFTPTPVPANTAFAVYFSGMKSPGTFRLGASDFRLFTVLPAAGISPLEAYADYILRWGTLVAGRKIFCKIVAVSTDTGQQSSGMIVSAVVTA